MRTDGSTCLRGVSRAARLFACAWLGLSSCAGTPRVHADILSEVPESLRGDYQSFTENCVKCHSLDRPLQARVTNVKHWDVYVARMMATAGSGISRAESVKILRFLYWYTERRNALSEEGSKGLASPEPETSAVTTEASNADPATVEPPREKPIDPSSTLSEGDAVP